MIQFPNDVNYLLLYLF